MTAISVLSLGHLKFDQIQSLQQHFSAIEAIDSTLPRETRLEDRGAELNRAIAAAASPWVLILREAELVDPRLADEIQRSIGEPPRAWGFRVRTELLYDGQPLLLTQSAGEIRLVHQRHARFRDQNLNVEGTIVRMEHPLTQTTFSTSALHEEFLRARGVPHSLLRRFLLFSRNALVTGALWRSRATLRYLWLEAGYDLSGER
jgi:hypothetical protein